MLTNHQGGGGQVKEQDRYKGPGGQEKALCRKRKERKPPRADDSRVVQSGERRRQRGYLSENVTAD